MKIVETTIKSNVGFNDRTNTTCEWNGVFLIDEDRLFIEGIGKEAGSYRGFIPIGHSMVMDDTDIYLAGHMDDSIISLIKLSNGPVSTQELLFKIPKTGLRSTDGLSGRWDSNSSLNVKPIGKAHLTFGREITDEDEVEDIKKRISKFKSVAADQMNSSINMQMINRFMFERDTILRCDHEEIEIFGIYNPFNTTEKINMIDEKLIGNKTRVICKEYGIPFPPKF